MTTKYTKTCPICGMTFSTTRSYKKYCSEVCAKIAHREVNRQYKQDNREILSAYYRNWRRMKAEKPAVPEKRRCPVCGETFTSASANRIYCSNRCKMKAFHKRQKVQQAADETMKRERYGTWERRNMAAIVCAPCGKYPTCFECGEEDCNWSRY